MSDLIMRRVGGYAKSKNPGDFWWSYTRKGSLEEFSEFFEHDPNDPFRLWYVNPDGEVGSIIIKQEDRAGWDWNGDLDLPTISPSIKETRNKEGVEDWHGSITDGRMTTA